MYFAPNPGILAAGNGGRTEDEWKAHLLTITPNGLSAWGQLNTSSDSSLIGDYRMVAASVGAGILVGTSELSFFRSDSHGDKMAIHACPDRPTFNDQSANARHLFARFADATDQIVFTSLNRNSYTSFAYDDGTPYLARYCTLFRWWDSAQQKVLQRNPSTGSTTTEYTW